MLWFLLPRIAAREPLSVALLKEIHAILTAGTYDETCYIARGERPGEFKKHDYVTGIYEVGFPPEEVEQAVSDLLDEVNEQQGGDVLLATAYLHARFEFIHPFAEGNGRVGRTLLNYYLMTHGEPPLIVYEEDKKDHHAALESYDADEEIKPLCDFLRGQTAKTWEKTLERTKSTPQRRLGLCDFEK